MRALSFICLVIATLLLHDSPNVYNYIAAENLFEAFMLYVGVEALKKRD